MNTDQPTPPKVYGADNPVLREQCEQAWQDNFKKVAEQISQPEPAKDEWSYALLDYQYKVSTPMGWFIVPTESIAKQIVEDHKTKNWPHCEDCNFPLQDQGTPNGLVCLLCDVRYERGELHAELQIARQNVNERDALIVEVSRLRTELETQRTIAATCVEDMEAALSWKNIAITYRTELEQARTLYQDRCKVIIELRKEIEVLKSKS
jgi:hypothetical protein